MAVQIIKPKAKVLEKGMSAQIVTPDVVDEYAKKKAKLDNKLKKLDSLTKKVDTLAKGILSSVDEVMDAGTPIDLQGFDYEIKIGAQGKRTALSDIETVKDMLGDEVFMKLATISAKDLKAYLTPDQVLKVTKSTYAIKRRMKVETL